MGGRLKPVAYFVMSAINIDFPRRDMTLALPRPTSDRIVHDVLSAEGWTIRNAEALRYRITLDDSPDQITINIQQPFKAVLRGKWVKEQPATLRFVVETLELSFNVGSSCPLLPISSSASESPRASGSGVSSRSSDGPVLPESQLLRSAIPPIAPPHRLPQPRMRESRSIDLR
jgi:hypothetical protein